MLKSLIRLLFARTNTPLFCPTDGRQCLSVPVNLSLWLAWLAWYTVARFDVFTTGRYLQSKNKRKTFWLMEWLSQVCTTVCLATFRPLGLRGDKHIYEVKDSRLTARCVIYGTLNGTQRYSTALTNTRNSIRPIPASKTEQPSLSAISDHIRPYHANSGDKGKPIRPKRPRIPWPLP